MTKVGKIVCKLTQFLCFQVGSIIWRAQIIYNTVTKHFDGKNWNKKLIWQNVLHVGGHLGWEQMNRQPDKGFLDLTACWKTIARGILMECWWPMITESRSRAISFFCEILRDFINLRYYVYSHWAPEHFGEKTEWIGPILRKIELF